MNVLYILTIVRPEVQKNFAPFYIVVSVDKDYEMVMKMVEITAVEWRKQKRKM